MHRMITKQRVKIEQIKRKQTCSVSFVSFSIPRKQVHDCSKEFLGNNKKDFLKNPPVTMIIT